MSRFQSSAVVCPVPAHCCHVAEILENTFILRARNFSLNLERFHQLGFLVRAHPRPDHGTEEDAGNKFRKVLAHD